MSNEEFEQRFRAFTIGLTRVEREAFRLLIDGKSHREIADRVCVCEKAIRARMTAVYRKLGLNAKETQDQPRKSIEAIVMFYKYCLGLDHRKNPTKPAALPLGLSQLPTGLNDKI